ELGERIERATAQLGLRPGPHDRSSGRVRGAHIGIREPGHGAVPRRYTPTGTISRDTRPAPQSIPLPQGCVASSRWARVGVEPLSGRNVGRRASLDSTLLPIPTTRANLAQAGIGAGNMIV